jgi:hypothetical protein
MPVIVETAKPILLIAPPQSTYRAWVYAQDLGDVNPRLPLGQSLHEGFVDLHGPLHRSLGIGHRHLPDGDDNSAACLERSDHLLSGADR